MDRQVHSFRLFFLCIKRRVHSGRTVMIDILIRFEFCFTDRRGRNQSGAVMRGCRIGQIIIGINQFLVFFLFHGQ